MKAGLSGNEGEVEGVGVGACLTWKNECLVRGGFYWHYSGVGGVGHAVVDFDPPFSFEHYRRCLVFF